MILRDYQQKAVAAIRSEFREHNSTLLVMPTGSGKTLVFAKHAEQILAEHPGKRAIVMAHRNELINQACDKIARATTLSTEVEKAEQWAAGLTDMYEPADVMVTSVQTQCAGFNGRGRMTRFDPFNYALLIIDEAHRSTADTYRRVVDYYRSNPDLRILGVTATPDRADEEALGQMFKSVAYVYGINDAIRDGWLVPIVTSPIYIDDLNFAHMKTTAGDLNGADLERELIREKPLHKMVNPIIENSEGRKTLIFAASVEHAKLICKIINRHKPDAARYVTGKTPADERKQLFADYAAGKYNYLCNVGITVEGYDEPTIEVVALCRPSKSRALVAQQIGRGTRPLGGLVDQCDTAEARRAAIASSAKPSVEIMDFVGNCGRHKLVHAADVLGGNETDIVIRRATQLCQADYRKHKKPVDVRDAIDRARKIVEEELEDQRRRNIKATVIWHKGSSNPFDVLDIKPWRERGWDKAMPASEKQTDLLRKFKIPIPDKGFTKAEASRLIGTMISRRQKGLCTFAQARVLKRAGYDTKGITFKTASRLITLLKANGWKRPIVNEVA